MQLRDFGRLASGNSRILVWLRFRVVKLTKALKPEKSKYRQRCQGVQVSDGLGGSSSGPRDHRIRSFENQKCPTQVATTSLKKKQMTTAKRYLPLTPSQPFKFRTSSAPQPPKTSALPVTISQTLDTSKTTRRPNHRGVSAACGRLVTARTISRNSRRCIPVAHTPFIWPRA